MMLLPSFFTYETDNDMQYIFVTLTFGRDKLAIIKIKVAMIVANIMYIIQYIYWHSFLRILWLLPLLLIPPRKIFILDVIRSSMFETFVESPAVYKEIFLIGNFHITILFIEFIVHIILNIILFLKVKSVYKTR